MSPYIRKPFTLLHSAVIAGIICIGIFTNEARAELECVPANAQAQLNILSPLGPVVGIVNFVIDGEPAVASVTINILTPPQVDPDGTQHFLSRVDYDFGGGDTINGVAVSTLIPTTTPGILSNEQQITYIGGTGRYESVLARFLANGTLSFIDNTGTQQGIGDICWPEIDDDDSDSGT